MIWNPPEEIKRLAAIWEPYAREILEGNTENIPQEVMEAYEKDRAWAWEQGQ